VPANESDFFALLGAFELPEDVPHRESAHVSSGNAKRRLEARWFLGN
jgi:hypothetical protein